MNTREHVRRGNALFLVIIFAYIIVNMLVNLLAGSFHISFTYVELILIAQIGYAAPAIWYAYKKPQPLKETIRLRKVTFLTIPLLVVFAYAIMPLMNFVSMLSLLVGKNHIQSTVSGMLTQSNLVICLLAIGILPAVLEEFVYRGVIYNEQREGNVKKAILCSGLFFGLLHMNINQFSYAFVVGIILAFTVEATGSILGSMIVHATINGHSVLLSWQQSMLAKDLAVADAAVMSREQILKLLPMYAGVTVVATIFAAFVLFMIIKLNKRESVIRDLFVRKEKDQNEEKTPFVDVYFVVAVLLAVLLMISRELS